MLSVPQAIITHFALPVGRISVRVRGGDPQGPAAGLGGMNLISDLGAAFFESHCEINDKTSSPFSSNRTMFETEEVRTKNTYLSAILSQFQTKLIPPRLSSYFLSFFRW